MGNKKNNTLQTLSRGSARGASRDAVEAYKKTKDDLNAEYAKRKDDPEFHRQIAADLTETIDYGFTFENLFGDYFDMQEVGFTDRIAVRERRGMQVFYTARGGYIEETEIRDEVWGLPRDSFGFHVKAHLDDLEANFADTIEDLAALGSIRMQAEPYKRMLQLLQAAVPSGSPYYVATSGLVITDVNAAVSAVRDAVVPDGTAPMAITIMGRAPITDKIADFNLGFNPIVLEEIRQRGRIGTYRGANVHTVHHYLDENDAPWLPANELYVFAWNVGTFGLYGGTRVKQWDENTVDWRHWRARRDAGGIVARPQLLRRIVDSSIDPLS